MQGTDGDLYGTTFIAGANGLGTVFKITPGGTLTTLYNFCSQTNCADGEDPTAGLVLGSDSNFYGITDAGGANGFGTVFKITSGGELTTLYHWCSQPNCADGVYAFQQNPGTFIEATDGNFYGANNGGGNASAAGTAFKHSERRADHSLHITFCSQTNCADGEWPMGLIQARDGNFYGTTNIGGAGASGGGGTVFKITPSGTLTTLYNFCSQTNCTDGANPFALLIQGADGNFYGTASGGSANGQGTVFRITPKGVLKTLYNFCSLANCTDGASPGFSLVQATDGNFYGTTIAGGDSSGPCANSFFAAVGCGTVFKITPGGKLTTLHSFDFLDSFGTPGVAQATNGTFYGTNPLGGPSNSLCTFGTCGTVFSLAVGLDLFVETVPSTGTVGKAVTILGTDLADATHVFLPRQRNLWVTDTVEWCREARLA